MLCPDGKFGKQLERELFCSFSQSLMRRDDYRDLNKQHLEKWVQSLYFLCVPFNSDSIAQLLAGADFQQSAQSAAALFSQYDDQCAVMVKKVMAKR